MSETDARHQALLAMCQALPEGEAFGPAFEALKAAVLSHFDLEAALRPAGDEAALEDLRIEREEFEYLAGEVATRSHFDVAEIQRFFSLWLLGHSRAAAHAG